MAAGLGNATLDMYDPFGKLLPRIPNPDWSYGLVYREPCVQHLLSKAFAQIGLNALLLAWSLADAGGGGGCFLAGTPELVVLPSDPVAAFSVSGLSSAPQNLGQWQRTFAVELLVLGVYGAYVIHRLNRMLMLKRAEEESNNIEPLEVALNPLGRSSPKGQSAFFVNGVSFGAIPIA